MTTYEWLLIAHLFSVFLLVACSGAVTVLGIAQGRTDSPRVMATLARLSEISERALIYPGYVLALLSGSWLVDDRPRLGRKLARSGRRNARERGRCCFLYSMVSKPGA